MYIIFYHIAVYTGIIYIQYIISWLYFLQSCSLIVLAQVCLHWGTEKGKKNVNWNFSVRLRSFNLVSLFLIIDSCSRSLIQKYVNEGTVNEDRWYPYYEHLFWQLPDRQTISSTNILKEKNI